jgi:hypothetical protein
LEWADLLSVVEGLLSVVEGLLSVFRDLEVLPPVLAATILLEDQVLTTDPGVCTAYLIQTTALQLCMVATVDRAVTGLRPTHPLVAMAVPARTRTPIPILTPMRVVTSPDTVEAGQRLSIPQATSLVDLALPAGPLIRIPQTINKADPAMEAAVIRAPVTQVRVVRVDITLSVIIQVTSLVATVLRNLTLQLDITLEANALMDMDIVAGIPARLVSAATAPIGVIEALLDQMYMGTHNGLILAATHRFGARK